MTDDDVFIAKTSAMELAKTRMPTGNMLEINRPLTYMEDCIDVMLSDLYDGGVVRSIPSWWIKK